MPIKNEPMHFNSDHDDSGSDSHPEQEQAPEAICASDSRYKYASFAVLVTYFVCIMSSILPPAKKIT